MKNSDVVNFKYRGTFLSNIVSFMFICLFIILSIVAFKLKIHIVPKILIILLILVLLSIWMYFANKKLSILNGTFIFDNDKFYYDTLRKSYEISYDEIDYVSKEIRINNNSFFQRENLLYRIKIKNAGSFIFYVCDNSVENAIDKLCGMTTIKYIDKTN